MAIVASEAFVVEHGLPALAVKMTSDLPSTFDEESCIKVVGFDMAAAAAKKVFYKTRAGGGASRLLLRQRTHHLRGFGTVQGGQVGGFIGAGDNT